MASTSVTCIDNDPALNFEAVGLWHKLMHLHGGRFPLEGLLSPQLYPLVEEPHDGQTGIAIPMDDLISTGYAKISLGHVTLYATVK